MEFLTVIAYVIFHEMMHSDLISWSKNNKMHIFDLRFQLEGAAREKDIYGRLLCKYWLDGTKREIRDMSAESSRKMVCLNDAEAKSSF